MVCFYAVLHKVPCFFVQPEKNFLINSLYILVYIANLPALDCTGGGKARPPAGAPKEGDFLYAFFLDIPFFFLHTANRRKRTTKTAFPL